MTPLEKKQAFANKMIDTAMQLGALRRQMRDYATVYNHRGWQGGGANSITDADLADLGITALQLELFVSSLNQRLDQMMTGQAIEPIQGDNIIDDLRVDL
jgi:hypothetical protein